MDPKTILHKLENHRPTILGGQNFATFAVLIPLVKKEDHIYVLFEVRSEKLRRQPGEICFPGGKIDKQDNNPQSAAIRETTEELGIRKQDIMDVYPIDYLVSPFEMIVYPHVGFISHPERIEPNPPEVGEVFMVPLTFFLETKPQIHQVHLNVQPDESFPFDLIVGGHNYQWRSLKMDEYFFIYGEKVIWGLTAKIISHFTELLQK
ncbi:NUDIX hydrolase [Aquibacillus albus]|uniref:8-oxo-dGTP pyrophosphatase MutT (NUDIX family) n=1 Tax=Aquibacillus albus TaxID=1168171 RepID=A0ABS2MXX6_9BACI|nr:CoA pyrophosphatase [Aquibacillus albus]MBM7570748.1 8-oxo-dGTP pyrophosphatase MutT (NUDIX family) [Aquibacillus albus]